MMFLGASIAAVSSAQARNVKYVLPISAALQSPGGAGKIDNSVKFFFGPQPHPAASKMGAADVSGKARIEKKIDIASCQLAFAEALQSLQKNAVAAGANAVVNIVSYHKNDPETSSATEFECRAGSFSTIVMLKGELVKLSEK